MKCASIKMIFRISILLCSCLLAIVFLGVTTLWAQEDPTPLIKAFKDAQYQKDDGRMAIFEEFPGVVASSTIGDFPGDGSNNQPLSEWSRVVAQAVTDTGWDIFVFKLDRTEVKRITSNVGTNTNPAMDHFAKRVVYTSSRNGSRDLFLASTDGSGESIQLTFGESHDDWASWSPDGSRIAFASNRTGSWEIYTINVDGSDLRQITHDPSAHDIMPSWSSRGVIAWTKRVGIQGSVWLMNSDGSHAIPVTRNYPYLSNPYWNHSGTAIAFDADMDKDFFNEVALVDLANQMLISVYDGGEFQDVWVNAWNPADDGPTQDALLLTRVLYAVQGNQVIITGIQLEKRLIFDPMAESEVIASSAAQADWRISDDQAPNVYVDRFLPYTFVPVDGSVSFWVRGNDPGGSGIVGYEMQESVNGGEWSAPQPIDVYEEGLVLYNPPQMGTEIAVRVRAYDRAGHYSNWTDSTHTTSWYYRSKVVGQVVDVWGHVLDNVQVTAPGLMTKVPTTDSKGRFDAYAANPGDYSIRVSKSGYADLPPLQVTVPEANEPEINQVFRLLPRENIIANGDFEVTELLGWSTIGQGVPSVVADAAYSGNGGLLLSQLPRTAAPNPISNGLASRYGSLQAVYDALGGLHITWPALYGNGSNFTWIHYGYCPTLETCSDPVVVTDGETNALALVGDKVGLLDSKHMPSESSVQIRYWEKEFEGWRLEQTWTVPKTSPGPVLRNLLWVDSNGHPHAMWIHNTDDGTEDEQLVISYTFRVDDIWQPVQQLAFRQAYYGTDIALLNTERNTTELYVTGLNPSSTSGESHSQIWRFEWNNTVWGNPTLVYDGESSQIGIKSIAVAQDLTGLRHLLMEDYYVYHLAEITPGEWSAPVGVAGREESDLSIGAVWVDIGLVTYWHGGAGFNSGGYYKVIGKNEESTDWRCISLPTYCGRGDVSVAVNPATKQGVMVHRLILPTDEVAIYVTPLVATDEERLIGVQRTLDLRIVSHQPVLDFVMKVQQFDTGGKKDTFRVWIETDKDRTLLTESVAENDHLGEAVWQRRTLDLSPWANQVVTATMVLENVVDGNLAAVYLDELHLGAWTTPIVQSAVVEVIGAEQELVSDVRHKLVILASNLMPNAAVRIGQYTISDVTIQDSTRLEAVLPDLLSHGIHSAILENPSGASTQFFVRSPIGHYLFLPSLQR